MEIQILVGDRLKTVIQKACALAIEKSVEVEFTLNDWYCVVNPGETPDNIFSKWEKYQEEKSRQWLESEEGKTYFANQFEHQKKCQQNLDEAMKKWPNFQDINSVLDWCKIVFENWIVGTNVSTNKILAEFRSAGMVPNMNLGVVYNDNCKQNSGLYLVGQFLSGVSYGGIPKIFSNFYNQWVVKWK